MTIRSIPFFDYPRLYLDHKKEMQKIFDDVGKRGAFIMQKDIIEFEKQTEESQIKTRKHVHLLMSFVLFVVILIFNAINNDSVIKSLFTVAGYTYGPLLGLFSFGLFTKWKVKDRFVPIIAILSPTICYILQLYIPFGFELLILNGLITFVGLYFIKSHQNA